MLGAQPVNVADDLYRNAALGGLRRRRGVTPLGSNQGQFAGIKPATAAARALVHLDPASGAEEVPLEFDARATGTLAFAGPVHDQALLVLDVHQRLTRDLMLFINPLQFESIKPNPAATALAGVHKQVADWEWCQFIGTGWAFHRLIGVPGEYLARWQPMRKEFCRRAQPAG